MRVGGSTVRRGLAAVVAALALSGCSGIPYAPGRWFEPSPTPGRGPEVGPTTVDEPDVDLTGTLVTEDGLRSEVRSRLWFGEATTSPLVTRKRPAGWTNVYVALTGSTAVTNSTDRPNAAATSVIYEYSAAYPAKSRLCHLIHNPEQGGGDLTGGYCWQRITVSTPFSYAENSPVELQPGESRSVELGRTTLSAGLSVDAPPEEVDELSEALRHPVRIVVTTDDIWRLDRTFRFAHACHGAFTGPSSSDQPSEEHQEQHVVVGTTGPITCAALPESTY
ncbi:MAG TPA: hypothetical protein VIT20_00515 [Propionibacteriaceae bacterium]